jgi:hypothetical protein
MLGTRNTHEVTGDRFDWKKGIGYTEASSIDLPPFAAPIHCISVKSHRTGRREFFFYEGRYTLGEDAVEYRYTSATGLKLIVYND